MSDRLRRLTPAELDDEQQVVYDAITGGDRAQGTQHFPLTSPDGSLNGPFGVFVHAPGVGAALQELGAAIRFRTRLSARVREIAILLVAHAEGSEFEWWAHERVGRAVGLTDEELAQLALGDFRSDDAVEYAVSAFVTVLLSSSTVTDEQYAAAANVLSVQQIAEITTLVGYYRTAAQLMNVFKVGIPEGTDGAH